MRSAIQKLRATSLPLEFAYPETPPDIKSCF